jgi:hypothetical protein
MADGLAVPLRSRRSERALAMQKTGGGMVPAAELLIVGYGARQHIRKNASGHPEEFERLLG